MSRVSVTDKDVQDARDGMRVSFPAPAGEVLVLEYRGGTMVIDKYTEDVYNELTAVRGERGGRPAAP